jgi:hypothetical protein
VEVTPTRVATGTLLNVPRVVLGANALCTATEESSGVGVVSTFDLVSRAEVGF